MIKCKHSGQYLDVSGASKKNGAEIIQWPHHGGPNQRWTLRRLDGGISPGPALSVEVHIPQSIAVYDPSKKCKISLLSHHRRFVCAEANGTINANRSQCTEYEQFISYPLPSNRVGLQSNHGKWVCAERGGKVVCDRNECNEWETFEVIGQGGKFGFKSWENKLLSAQSNHTLQWNRYWVSLCVAVCCGVMMVP